VQKDDASLAGSPEPSPHPTFEEIYARFGERTLNLLYRFTGDRDAARDLLQDVFLSVYQNLNSFERRSDVSTWIHKIAVNRALNHLKRERRTTWINILDESVGALLQKERIGLPGWHTADPPLPDRALEERQFSELAEKAIRDLPLKYRTAFLLYRDGELSNGEIARVLGLSVSAVETRIHRAKKALLKRLKPHL
jgi:RNA polymerase sigma-70 factor (ECF subfamily)